MSADLLDVREWLRQVIEDEGVEVTGSSMSMTTPQADIDIVLNSRHFRISIRPLEAREQWEPARKDNPSNRLSWDYELLECELAALQIDERLRKLEERSKAAITISNRLTRPGGAG